MKNPNYPYEHAESDAIRADIRHTRESMDQTIDEIGERIQPSHLLDEILNFFRSRRSGDEAGRRRMRAALSSAGSVAGKATTSVANTVREHPIPALLIGAGIAWAWYESRHPHDRGNGHRQGRRRRHEYEQRGWREEEEEMMESEFVGGAGPMKERVKSKMAAAGERLQEKTHKLREQMAERTRSIGAKASELSSKVTEGAKHRYQVSRDKFVETSHEHPLCVGAGFLAAGVLAGLALPSSYKEDEWIGGAADRVKHRAKETGRDLMERGKKVASAAAEAARKSGGEEQQGTQPSQKQRGEPGYGDYPAQS